MMRLEVVCVEDPYAGRLCGGDIRTVALRGERGRRNVGIAPYDVTEPSEEAHQPAPKKRKDMRPQASKQALRLVCVYEEFKIDKR